LPKPSATLNWKQIPIVLSVVGLFFFIWAMLLAEELGCSGFVDYGTTVSVPRNMNHATVGGLGFKRSMTLSLPKEGDLYWESRKTAKESLPDKIKLSAGKPESNGIVYVEGAFNVRYQEIVDLLKLVRQAGLERSRILVGQQSVKTNGTERVGWFEVKLEPESNSAPDIAELKPDPFKLVAGIRSSGKLSLNATNIGTIDDPSFLTWKLTQIFAKRVEAGFAERGVTVKADNEIEYGEVAKLVDSLTGAGADPIVMQLDAPHTIPKKAVTRR